MLAQLNIITIIDVEKVLITGSLHDHLYLVDNGVNSANQGTPDLSTGCTQGQVINWLIYPVPGSGKARINDIKFTQKDVCIRLENYGDILQRPIPPQVYPPVAYDYWAAMISADLKDGLYTYSLELEMTPKDGELKKGGSKFMRADWMTLSVCTRKTQKESAKEADLVFTNGKVITVDSDFSIKQAVAVQDGKIIAVGANDEIEKCIGDNTKVLDLKGKPILPGINESHMHAPFFGATRPPLALDLTSPAVKSIKDMVSALDDKVKAMKPGEWIRGFGWAQNSLEECISDPTRLPRKGDLDAVSPDNPVAFTDFSCHTLLVNSKVLEMAGVNKDTPDPPSGEMERDSKTGEPTGIFKEPDAQALVSKVVPLLTRQEKKAALLKALALLNANGVTSFTDAAIGPGGENYVSGVMSGEFVNIYKELLEEGMLTARANVLLLYGGYGALTIEDIKNNIKTFEIPTDIDKSWLNFPGIKIFADGMPLTHTSWMNKNYIGKGAGHGASVVPGKSDKEQRKKLIEMIEYVHSKGYQIGVHATGDQAIDAAVDGFVKAIEEQPLGDPRHYIIHGDFISREKAEALAKHNCGISMQPYIKSMIADFEIKVVGKKRAAYEFPTRTVLDAGLKLTSSSDAPVTYPNWRLGIQSAVLREGVLSGNVSGKEECITVEEAIRTYTINGAWQDHMEDVKGSIEVGKFADFCIIGDDILTIDPRKIGDIPVLGTIVGGKIVYEKNSGAFSSSSIAVGE